MPIGDFVDKLEELDFKTDHQAALIAALDHKKTKTTISGQYLDGRLNKAFAKVKVTQSVAATRVKDLDAGAQRVLAVVLR